MAYKILILIISVVFVACSPVRTGKAGKAPRGGEASGRQTTQQSSADNIKSNVRTSVGEEAVLRRFSDTTYVYLDGYQAVKQANTPKKKLNDPLSEAIRLFDQGNTAEACGKISNILSNISKDSQDYPETLFYTSECYIAKNQFEPARRLLIEILEREDIANEVMEKSLVRLGQVYCIAGDKASAERLFRQLRRQFPNSVYKPIADCDAIGK